MNESDKRAAYIEDKKITLLVTNLASSMIGTIINCLIIGAVLWDIIPEKNIIIWVMVNIIFVLIRYTGLWMYKKGFKEHNYKFWKTLLLFSFFISGTLFGSSGFFLISPQYPEHTVFLYFVCGGMMAGALGAYHNHLPVFYVYSITVFLLPTVAIYNIHTSTTSAMSAMGIVFFFFFRFMQKK
ncbi:membrane hypothetical protein [Desulfamplus magnetovallimortis]|uniref:Uncharacterized protein n=1 Tax=Desulfamplus magnetovallimortis TaxID=1246637 RepID=A0A1W1H7E5_9BACT|nr:hypothetical protein [Desulfamplus magnetovallimortis]SLM28389.1 membrane hypothetical protein [Desulfamplus magnetovallimortis]